MHHLCHSGQLGRFGAGAEKRRQDRAADHDCGDAAVAAQDRIGYVFRIIGPIAGALRRRKEAAMPAFVTHELFGTQVFGQLDEEIQEMLEMNPAPS